MNNVKNEMKKAFQNIENTTEKAVADVKLETEKALNVARKPAKNPVQDLSKEVGKHIPEVMIKAPKFRL